MAVEEANDEPAAGRSCDDGADTGRADRCAGAEFIMLPERKASFEFATWLEPICADSEDLDIAS